MTRRGMVYGVGATPEIVGCQGDHANDATRPVVRTSIGKERPMTAVMLDHEQTYEKASGGNNDKERKPPLVQPEGQPPPGPQSDKRQYPDRQPGRAAKKGRL